MKKIAASPELSEDSDGDWFVEWLDPSGDGGLFSVGFFGPDAEKLAREYAAEKFSEPPQHEIALQRYQ